MPKSITRLIVYTLLHWILLLFLLRGYRVKDDRAFFGRQPWTAGSVVCLILLVNVLQLGTSYVSLHYAQIWKEVPPHLLQWFLAVLALVFFRVKRVTAAQLGVQKKGAIRWVLLGAGVGLVNYGVYHVLSIVLTSGVDIEISRIPNSVPGYAYHLFVAVLAAPVVEELLYRGIVYPPYRNRYNPMVAIAIVSALFSLSHFELSLDAILVALCWGALYELTETIVAPIAAHSTYNLLWVVTEFLQH